jgi:hypothetical protein
MTNMAMSTEAEGRWWVLLAAASMLAAAWPALAQPKVKPILELKGETDWTLRVSVTVRTDAPVDPRTKMPNREPLVVDSAAVVFPMPVSSASHIAWTAAGGTGGELKVDHRISDNQVEWLTGYHSGVRLGRWDLQSWRGEVVTLNINYLVTSFRTEFDEAAASRLDWPEAWPAPAQSTLQPQLFVDMGQDGPYDMEPVKQLVKRWTEGKDPRTVKPVVLAKYFAGQVWAHVQPSGGGLTYNRTGELEGIDLQGAPQTARTGRGTEFDMVCLLAAVYREAGLPARTVIGYDAGARRRDSAAGTGRSGSGSIRAWVEFALMDEQQQLVWVPVDIVRMRKSSSRPPDRDRPWRWFGTHDELDGVIPFAFHFHPPTTVVAHGSPAFWGWMVSPKPPDRVRQTLRIEGSRTPKRGGAGPRPLENPAGTETPEPEPRRRR